MPYTLELKDATQDAKNEILCDLYGVASQNDLRYATTKTDAEILSAEGEVLISLLQSQRPPGPGCCHFTTAVSGTSQTITVKTSTGYARLVNPDNTPSNSAGTGVPTANITLTIPAVLGANRAYAIISTQNSTSTTAFGNITSVTISGRRINAFSGSGLSACTNLSLVNNRLTSFDGSGLSACTNLSLNDNQLTSFSGSGLSACTTLDISSNQLTSFDGSGLSACTTLYLNSNQLTSFFGSGLSACTTLDISSNQLTSFDGSGLSACTTLSLFDNLLTSFDGSGLSSCITLYVNNNQLTSFSSSGLNSCITLELNNNNLASFSSLGLGACRSLNLSNNQLTEFNGSGLRTSLRTLVISNNREILQSFMIHSSTFSSGSSSVFYLNNSVQTTESLNMVLSALPPSNVASSPDIDIRNNPGSLTCNPALAPAAWLVITS